MLIKRLFDILISMLVIFFLCPIMLIIYLLVKISFGNTPFFLQERVGKDNKVFKIIKFRTMKESKDKYGNDLPDFQRITRLGAFLRSTSLDELPELINVIKGDMSLVGPRPLLTRYLSLYSEEQLRRHNVLPGITGLAQVNGRNTLTWNEKFKLDIWYVDNRSLLLDIKILFLTIYKVIKRDGINQSEEVTMEYFNGKN